MIESVEKLREALKGCITEAGVVDRFDTYWITASACDKYIDEIEAEIAERYIELPVDADGVPIHIGDLVTHPFFEGSREVRSLTKEQGNPYWHLGVDKGKVTAHTCRHAKLRTVEDVLRELRDESRQDQRDFDLSAYVAELREMMGGE